jgi:hypothetical protein
MTLGEFVDWLSEIQESAGDDPEIVMKKTFSGEESAVEIGIVTDNGWVALVGTRELADPRSRPQDEA